MILQFNFNDLGLDLSGNVFTMDKTIGFDLFLRNNGTQPLTLRNAAHVAVEDTPDWDEDWPEDTDAMVCMVRFDYGQEAGSLTTPKNAQLITASLVDQPNWSILHINQGQHAPYWKFLPQDNYPLQPGECITVRFSSIHLSDQYGEANLYFLLKYGQNYSRNLPIKKVYMPRILSLLTPSKSYHLGETIQLQWELENALDCKQYFNGSILPDSVRQIDVKAVSDDRHTLNVVNQAGDGNFAEYHIKVPCIDQFKLVTISHKHVEFYWKAFEADTEQVYIQEFPGESLELEETKTFSRDIEEDCSFTLVACQRDSTHKVYRTINYTRPTLQAQASRWYWAPPPMGLPKVKNAFLSPTLVRQSAGLTDSIVTMKAPYPIEQVTFSWTTTNAVHIEVSVDKKLLGTYTPDQSPTLVISTSVHQATVTAIDQYGYRVEQTVTF